MLEIEIESTAQAYGVPCTTIIAILITGLYASRDARYCIDMLSKLLADAPPEVITQLKQGIIRYALEHQVESCKPS